MEPQQPACHCINSQGQSWVTAGMFRLLWEKMACPITFKLTCRGSVRNLDLRAPVGNFGVADDGEKQPRVFVKERKKKREKEGEKGKEEKKVLFIEASCLGLGASSPSSCYFTPATPLPLLAQVQLNVDFNASESTRLILYMINCQRHGWPYGTEKASSNSYFCM
ncbi:hypothetical protein P7K49_036359 [Saguinus oedipus]|uniref:Uncharacterized protein n=1 Tax=Saguinus oedipus TaxID=9490 RepID=A0ABQ9TK18_SAGOE|nr:hypothetical protein P7K49_036359 [Saguinus oedipus]